MECDELCPEIFENDCNKSIIMCMLETQYNLFKSKAHIIRRKNVDKGNFFDEYMKEDREYIPIYINVSRYRDNSTKDEKDTLQKTETFEVIYIGEERILRTDLILYQGAYYDVRDLFTQEWNDDNDWLFQKFNITYIQDANDYPTNKPPE